MSIDTVDKLIWSLIYGGIVTLCLGLFVRRENEALGWTLLAIGMLATAGGALLVWVRSRMKA